MHFYLIQTFGMTRSFSYWFFFFHRLKGSLLQKLKTMMFCSLALIINSPNHKEKNAIESKVSRLLMFVNSSSLNLKILFSNSFLHVGMGYG